MNSAYCILLFPILTVETCRVLLLTVLMGWLLWTAVFRPLVCCLADKLFSSLECFFRSGMARTKFPWCLMLADYETAPVTVPFSHVLAHGCHHLWVLSSGFPEIVHSTLLSWPTHVGYRSHERYLAHLYQGDLDLKSLSSLRHSILVLPAVKLGCWCLQFNGLIFHKKFLECTGQIANFSF